MRPARGLVLRPFAKINLSLVVGPAQADGFHDVRTLLQSIALCDALTATPRSGAFRFTLNTPSDTIVVRTDGVSQAMNAASEGVPADRTNLVWRAAAALWRAMGKRGEPRDAQVTLTKSIPAAAGLGGGSSDAAAALIALNHVWGGRRTRAELVTLAAGLGADVPFFLQGGTAIGVGRGDDVYPVDDISRLGVVLLTPAFGVATADAYRWLDEDRAASRVIAGTPSRVDVGWPGRSVTLVNDLQGAITRRFPEVQAMVEACLSEGALGAAMTGSGSAVFGLFPLAAANRAASRLRRPGWHVLATRTLTRREAGRLLGL